MATPAQLLEKSSQQTPSSAFEDTFTPEELAEQKSLYHEFATAAQRAEKSQNNLADEHPTLSYDGAATPAQLSEKAREHAPPLPPRPGSNLDISQPDPTHAPPPYSSEFDNRRNGLISEQWRSHDPRSSSTHSLVPSESARDGRRILLLIFIHGFLGTETSFQSFPAHIHNLLTITLEETHVVHTKIYPRYKSRKPIQFATGDFSAWLEPHENDHTDVVLLGHSMGGILAADVALLAPYSSVLGKSFRHRILGTINFDTPFLGMHPGVISSGIGSLFRPAETPGQKTASSSTSETVSPFTETQDSHLSPSYPSSVVESDNASQISLVHSITSPTATPSNDPFFNPAFVNDHHLAERKGWSGVMHFVNKHSGDLVNATTSYFKSHIEFGGCLADYPGLKTRYARIRTLEDVDDITRSPYGVAQQPSATRIRFVNYYTASTGRLKEPKTATKQAMDDGERRRSIESGLEDMTVNSSHSHLPILTPQLSVEEHRDGSITAQQLEQDESPIKTQMDQLGANSGVKYDDELPDLQYVESIPITDDEYEQSLVAARTEATDGHSVELKSNSSEPSLPPIPPEPTEPAPIDLDIYTDKDARKIAEKEQKRLMKAYQQAVKDREHAIKDRQNLEEKRKKKAEKEQEKLLKAEEKQKLKQEQEEEKIRRKEMKEEEKQRMKQENENEKLMATINPETAAGSSTSSMHGDKPKKDKKFCMLPPAHGGKRDRCWVRVYMEGVDEVGAHCGLFFPGPQYESLVGDVGERIRSWVEEDATRRAILAAETED